MLGLVVIIAFVLVALNASAGNNNPQVTVVYATRDLKPRIPVTADSLATKALQVPASYPHVYFTNVSDVLGMIPLVTISSGQAITANDVVKPSAALGSQGEFRQIPHGYVAMTIPTSEQVGVGDYIQPGDYIAVIAIVATPGHSVTRTIFTQLHVIKVGTQAGGSDTTATSLVVVITQCQAEIITWFQANANLKYTLESYHDYAPGDQAPDPNCQSVNDAHGVTLQFIKSSFPGLF